MNLYTASYKEFQQVKNLNIAAPTITSAVEAAKKVLKQKYVDVTNLLGVVFDRKIDGVAK